MEVTKLVKARSSVVLDEPYFASILMKLKQVEAPDLNPPTMATDGKNLFFHPEYVKEKSVSYLKLTNMHEVGHVFLLHHLRRGDRDPKKWNVACDFVVNAILKESGYSLPEGWLYDPKFNGMSAEQVFDMLPDQPGGGGGAGQPGGEGDQPGEVLDYPGDKDNYEQAEQEVKVMVKQAANYAKQCGKLPAGVERLVDELLKVRIPWREVLARFFTEQARNDYTFAKPNRRYLQTGFVLPALESHGLGDIVLMIDTSGSISASELKEFASEISGIMELYETDRNLDILYCDTECYHESLHLDDIPQKMKPQGGGGTDFIPPFNWVQENRSDCRAAIYFTDGYCSSFPDQPGYPTLWVVKGNGNFQPPFGEVVEYSAD